MGPVVGKNGRDECLGVRRIWLADDGDFLRFAGDELGGDEPLGEGVGVLQQGAVEGRDGRFRHIPIQPFTGVQVQPQQHQRGQGVAAGDGIILHIFGAVDQGFVVIGRVKKATVFGIQEAGEHGICQLPRPGEPFVVKGVLVKRQQAVGQEGVIFQVTVQAAQGLAGFPGAQ